MIKDDRCGDHDHLVGAAAGLIADGGFIGMTYLVGFRPLIVVGGLEFNGGNLYAEHREVLGEGHIGAHGVAYRVGEGASCTGGGTESGDANVFVIVQQVFKIGAGLQDGHDFRVGKDVFLAGVAHDHAVIGVGVGGGQHHLTQMRDEFITLIAKPGTVQVTIESILIETTDAQNALFVRFEAAANDIVSIAANGNEKLFSAVDITVKIADHGLAHTLVRCIHSIIF